MTQPVAVPSGPPPPPQLEAAPAGALPEWGPARRIAFRFVFCYLGLYTFPRALGLIPGTEGLGLAYFRVWDAILSWVAKSVLHLRTAMAPLPEGGGDSTTGFVQLLCMVAFATVATLVWTLMDRRSTHYRRLHAALRFYIRYPLAYAMLFYGILKIFRSQFLFPHAMRLDEAYGDASPLGLLWTFMGFSASYSVFTGLAEAAAGFLLFFRRTTTLGALLAVAAMANVTMINFSYDVHVKHLAGHLLLMGVFLLAPDLRRLADLLVLNRPTTPPTPPTSLIAELRRFDPRWLRLGGFALKTLFIGFVLVSIIKPTLELRRKRDAMAAKAKAGRSRTYAVEEFFRNGRLVPASPTDARRWEAAGFDGQAGWVLLMDTQELDAEYDPVKQTVVVLNADHKTRQGVLSCSRPDKDHLVMSGRLANDSLVIILRQLDSSQFFLVRRGFHWIDESPMIR